jgi:hypothetical protein
MRRVLPLLCAALVLWPVADASAADGTGRLLVTLAPGADRSAGGASASRRSGW